MLNSYVSAKLFDNNLIKVVIFSDIEKSKNDPICLITNGSIYENLKVVRQTFYSGIGIYECASNSKIELGNSYYIMIKDFGIIPLNVNDATSFKDFDKKYYYDGKDLGFTYEKEKTTFKVWAPLASKVVILLRKNKEDVFVTYVMKREDCGVYTIVLKGDYEGFKYRYKVTNSGLAFVTTDPYAIASSANGEDSIVIDKNKCKVNLNNDKLPVLDRNINAVIYELNVRDFTISKDTNIENKGKYLGLSEENRLTKGKHPAGLDYLKFLGITHVQVLPLADFKSVNELDPNNSYNWGYDPQQYFVPEGSYSSNPNDPYARIIELKKMVAAIHKAGIKVNMDVVFNHVYEYQTSVFEKIVPNYYFRKCKNGTLSNNSFCGDDLETRHPMVRKMILDSIEYWMNEYGIDGFRFDLMGLIDIDTMKLARDLIKKIKPDAMIYGEGWDMAHELPHNERCSYLNSFKTENISYFNDSFRDIVRGPNGSKEGGYLLGNTSYREGFKYVLQGSCVDYCYPARFMNSNQSINYCECHDNETLFDKIHKVLDEEDNDDTVLRIIRMINLIISISHGVPFYHAGQEIGLSKKGLENTYNSGDKYNMFDYSVLDKRFEMAMYLKSIIQFKKAFDVNRYETSKLISKNIEFIDLENGGLMIRLNNMGEIYKDCLVIVNPTSEELSFSLEDYYEALVTFAGAAKASGIMIKDFVLNPFEINAFVKRGDINE